MADLDVQPRRKSQFWLWVLIIFALGVLLFIFLNKDNTETSADKVDSDTTYSQTP